MVRRFVLVGVAAFAALVLMGTVALSSGAPRKAAQSPTATATAPAKTGKAGLLGTTGTSMALVIVLGVFAATMVAGARTATRGR